MLSFRALTTQVSLLILAALALICPFAQAETKFKKGYIISRCPACDQYIHTLSGTSSLWQFNTDGCSSTTKKVNLEVKELSTTKFTSTKKITENSTFCNAPSTSKKGSASLDYDFDGEIGQPQINDPFGLLDGLPGLFTQAHNSEVDTDKYTYNLNVTETVRVPGLLHRDNQTADLIVNIYNDDGITLDQMNLAVTVGRGFGGKVKISPQPSSYNASDITWVTKVVQACDEPYLSEVCPNNHTYNDNPQNSQKYNCENFSLDATTCLQASGIAASSYSTACFYDNDGSLAKIGHSMVLVPGERICQPKNTMCLIEPQTLKEGADTDGLRGCATYNPSIPVKDQGSKFESMIKPFGCGVCPLGSSCRAVFTNFPKAGCQWNPGPRG